MTDSLIDQLEDLRQSWTNAVTSLVRGPWLVLDTGLRATQTILATTAPVVSASGVTAAPGDLFAVAQARVRAGLAPPRQIYLSPYREHIDWNQLPAWARPSDPDLFEGCGHEG